MTLSRTPAAAWKLRPMLPNRRKLKLRVFCWTALGISLWLSTLYLVSPKLTQTTWLGRKLLSGGGECQDHPDWVENGGVALYFVGVLYLFLGIAIVCDDFFIQSLSEISERLSLSEDVAGATFMAAGSSAPELFSSLMAITNDDAANDIGVGTIVGSAVFNILVIIGVTAVFAGRTLHLDYRPLVRDAIFYATAIVTVIVIFHDSKVHWWEGLICVALYGLYIVAMKYNSRLMEYMPALGEKTNRVATTEIEIAQVENGAAHANGLTEISAAEPAGEPTGEGAGEEEERSPFEKPPQWQDVPLWLLSLPWYTAFTFSIPPCQKAGWENYYILTFVASIVWIGAISWFMVAWASDIGCVLGIPTAIMGVTVLAAGTSIPDALSSIVVAKQGMADMAVANAVGSNVFDIWLGLGLPWLVAIPFKEDGEDGSGAFIEVENKELLPNVLILFGVLMFYLASIIIAKMHLYPKEGYLFISLYVIYAVYNVVCVWILDVYGTEDDDEE